jgi:hypothetical protein
MAKKQTLWWGTKGFVLSLLSDSLLRNDFKGVHFIK